MTDQRVLTVPRLLVDDLTAIRGIGMARQTWFRQTCDVKTYRDLAALDADDIMLRLQAEGKPASRVQVVSWLEQAAQLVEKGESADDGSARFAMDGEALFHEAQASQWLQDAADDPGAAKEDNAAPDWDAASMTLNLKVHRVQVIRAEALEEMDGTASRDRTHTVIKRVQPFTLQVIFSIDPPAVMPQSTVFTSQFYLRNLTAGERWVLEAPVNQSRAITNYYYSTREGIRLNPGLYRLEVVIQGEETPALGYSAGPFLQVV